MFVLSAVSGVGKGVQFLSNFNMVRGGRAAAFICSSGRPCTSSARWSPRPATTSVASSAGASRPASSGGAEWLGSWTIFYWVWWMSWTPFVGTFLARISKGRTIREFVIGVLLIPSGVSFVWFAILGGSAINLQLSGEANLVDDRGPAGGRRCSRCSSSSRSPRSRRSS